ncbi:unnamed protein product [Rhodiola kirilowii]
MYLDAVKRTCVRMVWEIKNLGGEGSWSDRKSYLLCKLQFRCDELEMGGKVPGF